MQIDGNGKKPFTSYQTERRRINTCCPLSEENYITFNRETLAYYFQFKVSTRVTHRSTRPSPKLANKAKHPAFAVFIATIWH